LPVAPRRLLADALRLSALRDRAPQCVGCVVAACGAFSPLLQLSLTFSVALRPALRRRWLKFTRWRQTSPAEAAAAEARLLACGTGCAFPRFTLPNPGDSPLARPAHTALSARASSTRASAPARTTSSTRCPWATQPHLPWF
jgi:hypothetical protein